MKKTILIWTIALALIGVSIYTVNTYTANSGKVVQVTPSPSQTTVSPTPAEQASKKVDFTLKDLDGNTVSISELKGKRIYVNFWATWCPPCKAEMPDLEKLYQDTKASDLVILAVNLGESKEVVQSFMEKNKYHFTVLLDSDNAIASQFGINSIPTSIFLDKDGNLIDGHTGTLTYQEMKDYVDALK